VATAVPLARVIRSDLEESVHLGHVAVSDAAGRLVAWAGDPNRIVFARSSMKPLQASVSLAAMRDDDLPVPMLAVMCASHNGEPVHVRTVSALLRRSVLGVSSLRCPPDWPMDAGSRARARGSRRVLHNCSGKHAGMVAASASAGWDLETYLRPTHPLQRRVMKAVLIATGLAKVHVGVDGCGVPVHGLPLASMATLFARLARPERLGPIEPEVTRAIAAMRAEPYLVAGRNRTDTALMREVPGLVVKSGAEGLACAAVLETGLGVAVKIDDGGDRAAGPALIWALAQLGAVSIEALARLDPFVRRPVTGGGRVVGELSAEPFRLRSLRH
jgi:L-asparaginase II